MPSEEILVAADMEVGAPSEVSQILLREAPASLSRDAQVSLSHDGKYLVNERLVKPVTALNNPLVSQLDLTPLEPFWFTARDGVKVQGFIIRPPGFDASKKYPVKFLIHGGPQGAWGDS